MKTTIFRKPTDDEIRVLEAAGNRADDWSAIEVTDGFATSQMTDCRLHGHVRIGRNTVLRNSEVRNYDIGDNVIIESVTALECRCESSFGNGVKVATMNENEGRSVTIYEGLTAQAGYLAAVYRHRSRTVARLTEMAEAIAAAHRSHIGHIGDGSRISGARFIRETNIGRNVTIDGCSVLQNGTVGDDSFIGVDVKAYDFITAQGVHIDNGSIIERCFIGEAVIMDKGFSASESLFFANSHCENGEAASIFAGPYTVSHHKSTLLIAGMFSFFNAGSGSNQSNHLFKSGAVHQSVHLRGCKFASGAYIMSPAIEAPFTMVLGHHSRHHDIADLPYSYFIENNGRSMLIPGANLTSYGTVRDIEKWPKRDKRKVGGDIGQRLQGGSCIRGRFDLIHQRLQLFNSLLACIAVYLRLQIVNGIFESVEVFIIYASRQSAERQNQAQGKQQNFGPYVFAFHIFFLSLNICNTYFVMSAPFVPMLTFCKCPIGKSTHQHPSLCGLKV